MGQIRKLRLKHFRGSSTEFTLNFTDKRRIAVIFGENGTGKSTIVDAIDFVCNQAFGSIADRSGAKAAKYLSSASQSKPKPTVELHFGERSWIGTLERSKPHIQPSRPPRAHVLRRFDITRVVEAKPSDRYEALKAFIALPVIEQAEVNLRKALKEAKDRLELAERQVMLSHAALSGYWRTQGSPMNDIDLWLEMLGRKDATVLRSRLERNEVRLEAAQEIARLRGELRRTLSEIHSERHKLEELEGRLERVRRDSPESTRDLIEVLQQALHFVESCAIPPNACPVCDQDVRQRSLAASIQAKLRRHKTAQDLSDEMGERERHEVVLDEIFKRDSAHYEEQCHRAAELFLSDPLYVGGPEGIAALGRVDKSPSALKAVLPYLDSLEERISDIKEAIQDDRQALSDLTTVATYRQSAQQGEQELRDARLLHSQLQFFLTVVEEERKQYTSDLMERIGADVNRMFEQIHPGEPLGGSSLELILDRRASVDLSARFCDMEAVPPGAYYSEAHLDTLGLCVYLAIAKHAFGEDSILVLDDVLGSVDEVHTERVVDLLKEQSRQIGHTVITTPSRYWSEKLRKMLGSDQVDHVELAGWDINTGIHARMTMPPIDDLQMLLSSPFAERQSIASKAGILLEYLLDELTILYQCPLPRKKQNSWTIGELTSGLEKSLKGKLVVIRVDGHGGVAQEIPLAPLIAACTSEPSVRNQVGAHYNPVGYDVSDAVVRRFGQSVIALAMALTCPKCGQIPTKDKSGSYRECGGGCGQTRLFPLQRPPS